jgi:hypothetical protein
MSHLHYERGNIKKNIILPEMFKNLIEKIVEKKVTSIPLTHKSITAAFLALYRNFNQNWQGYTNGLLKLCGYTRVFHM